MKKLNREQQKIQKKFMDIGFFDFVGIEDASSFMELMGEHIKWFRDWSEEAAQNMELLMSEYGDKHPEEEEEYYSE